MHDPGTAKRPRPGAEDKAPGLSPVRAFFLLAALAGLIPLGLLATRDEATPAESPPAVRSPDYSLTDAEAVAEFERLNGQLLQAYRQRDITLAEQVFTSDSPMLPRIRREIRTLIRSETVSRTRFTTEETRVTRNDSSLVELHRVEVLRPRFETESGEDATAAGEPQRQEVEWTLRLEESRWLLHDAVILDVELLVEGSKR